MADPAPRTGRALRVYQMALILGLGWFAGRLPGLLDANQQEKAVLADALGMPPAHSAIATRRPEDLQLAADVAARVAAEVADQTIRRLIAAGWAPREATQGPLPFGNDAIRRAPERTLRILVEQPPATPPLWSLPPTGASFEPGPLPAGAPQAPAQATPEPSAASPANARAHALATAAYAALGDGNRRRASILLGEAIATAPQAPQSGQWAADRQQLNRRWSIGGHMLSRSGGVQDPLAASPVLGGGQGGAAIGYVLDPLSAARVSLIGRIAAAASPNGALDRETTQAALGVRVQPFQQVPLAFDVERRFALGLYSRNGWAARVSGGSTHDMHFGTRRLHLEGYGEAGAIGLRQTALYAGGQLRGGTPLLALGRVALDGGAGVWGAVQQDYGRTSSRLDFGPSAQFRINPWPFRAQVDYRVQAAGNARPGTGPVITVSGDF